ncbi:MAG: metallophosphoesterase [Fibromonadaceae bacterium]|jgi:bis(5'-nucleosyl)-tetraphosphatase (symmetrical)|nr:metallophosphoesterase [Fibromonadaceae bacterium]
MSRSFFIGDVHGCVEELAELVEKFSPSASDDIYQTGDLINKGPDTVATLKFIQGHNIKCVMGNHEAKLLLALDKHETELTPKELKLLASVKDPEWVAGVVSKFPLWMDTGKILLLHAGLEPGKNLEEMERKKILSIRLWNEKPWYEQTTFEGRLVIFGHWAINGLIDFPHAKGLDTGCVYGKLLTGYCPEENKFYHVAAKKVYSNIKV